jgi:Secretion system C-terminal sorting domain
MKKILLFISLFTALVGAQTFSIKQMTNLNADCLNFSTGGFDFGPSFFVFEAHTGNSSSVYLGQYLLYYSGIDTFAVITRVTDDNFMNIKPKLLCSNDSLFIIYQTNKNGNWAIAYRVYWNNQLSPAYYVADSSQDEINPVVSKEKNASFSFPYQFVSYERGYSVYINNIHVPGLSETEIFHGDDSTKYSQVTQEYIPNSLDFFVAARKVVKGKSFIVYKKFFNNSWGNENVLVSTGNCRNPRIQTVNNIPSLNYTDDVDGKSNIYLVFDFPYSGHDPLKVFDTSQFDYDDLWSEQLLIVTKAKNVLIGTPYTYKASRNDSLFIRLNKEEIGWYHTDTLINTKAKNSSLRFGNMGFDSQGEVFYTFWEDSINGKVQIFGRREIDPLGGIKDEYSPANFILYQNYPNPFNPATTINYSLVKEGFVKLTVYNAIGSKVAMLVNEYKHAGNYSVQFNGSNLASGIYLYRLESGNYSSAKKIILMK